MSHELDCRGLQCPQPVIRCRQLLDAEKPEKITVIVDNQAALENVTRYLTRNGYDACHTAMPGDMWKIEAIKNGSQTGDEQKTGSAAGLNSEYGSSRREEIIKTLVLITTDTLGRGDDELGAKLMATFLATLPELGPSLWRVVLLNGGVKLAAEPGAPLDSLKKLAGTGVDILVCGTCLTHYGLLDKKQVGETTNMMDVVSSMALADKVIRP